MAEFFMPTAREYFYRIDLAGRLFHDGTELTDAKFLDFFFKRLKANDTGRHTGHAFVSPCAGELNFVACDDTPVVFHRLREEPDPAANQTLDRPAVLSYAANLSVPFRPEELRFSPGGALYHPAPAGGYGRLGAQLLLEIGRAVEAWGPYYAYRGGGGRLAVIAPLEAPAHLRVLRGGPANECFGCGPDNPIGLGLSFLFDAGANTARSWFTPGRALQGGEGRVHGGFIALMLDEVMVKVLTGLGHAGSCPTAHLELDFRRPLPVGQPVELFARLEKQEGRKFYLRGEVRSPEASPPETVALFAEARALYVKVEK